MNFYRVLGSAANETRLGVVNRRRFLLSSAGVSAAVLGGPRPEQQPLRARTTSRSRTSVYPPSFC